MNSSNNDDRLDSLRQELLEYYFGCHPDPDGMRERLETDAEVRALYEEVEKTGGLLEEAALCEAPPLDLTTPQVPPRTKGRRLTFRRAWVAAAALVAIALTPALGMYGWRVWQQHDLETSNVRLVLSTPPAVPDGSPLRFKVETYNLVDERMIAQVDWKVIDEKGETLAESTVMSAGVADITVPTRFLKPRKLIVSASVPRTGFTKTIEQAIHPSKAAPLVHVTSDKPAYRPGEPVHLRIACLDRLTLRGVDHIGLRCRITNPRGGVQQQNILGVGQGVAAWTWPVPAGAMGGTYALEVRDRDDQFTLERLEFLVRNFQPPKLKKKITLDRQTYAAGQSGTAILTASRTTGGAGGGAPAGASVHATLLVDGDERWKSDGILDGEGRVEFTFQVPSNVLRGAARFVARITDGGNVETILQPFVIPTDKVEVAFFPEGGDLVAGTQNRVYAQVRDALGRPLSGAGTIVDDKGVVVAQFKTEHMGRTRFHFTPEKGKTYKLKLESPKRKTFDLPEVKPTGVVLRASSDFVAAGEPAKLQVFTNGRGPWIAGVYCRGVQVGQHTILRQGLSQIDVSLLEEASGVLRVTIFDRKLRPVAERLIRRDGKRNIQVTLTPAAERTTPGSKQKIRVKTIDETGEPVSCVVGLTVSDRAVQDMVEFIRVGLKDQHELFGDVEKPDEKVDEFLTANEDYRRNVDLLLGSMGWRRYVWQGETDEKALLANGGEWARALKVREGRSWAPLVRDTKRNYEAALTVAAWSRQEAWKWLVAFFVFAVSGLGLLGAVHGLTLFSRRMNWRPPIVITGAFAALVLVLLNLPRHFDAAEALGVVPRMAAERRLAVFDSAGFPARGGAGDDVLLSESLLPSFFVNGVAPPSLGLLGNSTIFYASPSLRDFDGEIAQGAVIVDYGDIAGFRLSYGRGFRGPGDMVPPGWSAALGLYPNPPRLRFPPPNGAQAIFGEMPRLLPFNLGAGGINDGYIPAGGQVWAFSANPLTQQQARVYLDRIEGRLDDLIVAKPPFAGDASLRGWGKELRDHRVNLLSHMLAAKFQYKHQGGDGRSDFAETLFWQPLLLTNEKGEASVEFEVSDNLTTWMVRADAHGGGRVGQGETSFVSFLPFHVTPKVPTMISEGDVVHIPVSLVADDGNETQAKITLMAQGAVDLSNPGEHTVALRDGRGRILAELVAKEPQGRGSVAALGIQGQVGKARDIVNRQFIVVPRGFPHQVSHGGNLKGKLEKTLNIPDDLAKRTAVLSLHLYPSPLATLEQGLSGMLREPHGCFEQVSSSNYPNVMVLSLLETSGDNLPAAAAKAQKMLASGYEKLTGYEVSGGGFEWWGKKPAHAALTAYGLMQFTDMSKVFEVEADMVVRTRNWLLGKRDGKGGFVTGSGKYGHFMGGSKEARSAYIAYSLLYSGQEPASMKRELDRLEERAKETKNAYELAVAACALAEANSRSAEGRPAAAAARARLLELQEKDGSLLGTGSITGSGKRDLRTETTSFAVLAWLAGTTSGFDGAVLKAVRFLEKQRQGGGSFGGTQATVMALKAITAYAMANTRSLKNGEVKVFIDDEEVDSRKLFGTEKRTITFVGLARHLAVGDNDIRVELTGGNEMPYSMDLMYRADVPVSTKDCALGLRTYLTERVIKEGGTTALHAVIENKLQKPVSNPMVIVGVPAGLHVSAKVLDDLKKAERIATWELTNQEIVLYLRGLKAEEKRDLVIELTGRIPGSTKGPASRAYLYYSGNQIQWVDPLEVVVTPGG